ncbi:MAG: hypothetical protein U1F54_23070 [Burkholderiales bacterium]
MNALRYIVLRLRPPPARAQAPAHFPPAFAETFDGLVHALGDRATPDRAIELEAATLLLESMRTSSPDWPADRFRALAGIMRGLRE